MAADGPWVVSRVVGGMVDGKVQRAKEGRIPVWTPVPIMAVVNNVNVPLAVVQGCNTSSADRYDQCEAAIRAAAAYNFPVLVGYGQEVIDKPTVVVGSGPSAIQFLEEIRARYKAGEMIVALKGAHDWLVKNGIIPHAAVCVDAQQSRAKVFKRLQHTVLYCCASQMHPDTWSYLAGRKVLIWHSRIGLQQETRPGWEKAFLVPTCATTGHSALVLFYLMGRRRFELYGFDSSIPAKRAGIRGLLDSARGRLLKLDGSRVSAEDRVATVTVNNQRFETTPAMAFQAAEIQTLLQRLPGIKVNAHGRGYYQAIIAAGKARGWPI